MIRMFSGLIAPVIGRLCGLLKRDGKVSKYRVVLATTLAVIAWGLWAGWVQWVVCGNVPTAGAFAATFFARWVMFSWILIVLLWSFALDKDDFVPSCILMSLFICLFGTVIQATIVHGTFDPPVRTHYWTSVSCEHCDESCRAKVEIGKSWTDWENMVCGMCGITIPVEKVPEYAETREAWEARITDGGGGGAKD